MNIAILVGNLTRDPELRTTPNGVPTATFTIAVTRRYKSPDGSYQSDFINCRAWRHTAEFINKYFSKGSKIGVRGNIQTRTYDDPNGVRKYITEVVVDDAEFVTPKSQNQNSGSDYYPDVPPEPQNVPAAKSQTQSADDLFAEELSDFQPLDDAELPF